ncbi:transcriptional regulator [Tamaricihabitans halophyticus]|uniref:Transcriptional regulator n=1 Tax=Tamaricihabitans halophyticus TaxID=1262583 RepID=A0A4R2QFD2_9PSEU|nr:sugar-binding domain-containing protein [Tamaricihabitans halophyticus]TCP47843.1 transcriptional regulator [Tamaricihabitans halophyticus]
MIAVPDERELTKAAVLYYQHDMTHAEVGRALGWSRIKVTRNLQRARALGLVEFVIHDPVAPFEHLEQSLIERYQLDACRVAPTLDDQDRTLAAVGRAGAELMEDFLPYHGVVAVGMSRAVSAMVARLDQISRPELIISAASGSVARTNSYTASALAIDLSRRLGATAHNIPAPLHSDPANVAALRREPAIASALGIAASAGHLVVGVGSMHPGGGTALDGMPTRIREQLIAGGAVGDLVSRYYDEDATAVASDLDTQLLVLEHDEVSAIPKKFVVVAGRGKARAVFALLRAGQITTLALDADLARSLLSLSPKVRNPE